MKLTETARKTIFGMLLVLGLILPMLTNESKADVGPKRTITINVKNAPQEYYIALYEDGTSFRDERYISELKEKHAGEKEHQAIDRIFGLKIRTSPDGDCCYRGSGSGSYRFWRSVPVKFSVVIVTLDGEIYQSNVVTKRKFNAVFEYDVSTGEIHELLPDSRKVYALSAASCYILTLILEGIVFIAFSFEARKKNWIHFFIANTVTQIILNLFVVYVISGSMTTFLAFMCYLGIEYVILVAEAIYYYAALRKKDGTRAGRLGVWYAAAANLTSLVVGSIIFEIVWYSLYK